MEILDEPEEILRNSRILAAYRGLETERFWQAAPDIYLGYPLYKQRIAGRRIPIIVLKPA